MHAEADANKMAAELDAARKELEVFSYSVSHDLRAPLRAVDGFSRILVEDYAERLDDDGRRMLGMIRAEAQRMGHLIDALLVFSRLGRQEMEFELIDMNEMVRTVFDELSAPETVRKLHLDLHPLPMVIGCRPMVRQVWEHLIGNSIKFTKGREIGEIEIGAQDNADGMPEYYIKDNGVGFDMQLAGKLFGIFQRFHSEQEFPGIGAGLALVQHIIHRHGGTIRAEAEVGKGAAFHFTLPNSKP